MSATTASVDVHETRISIRKKFSVYHVICHCVDRAWSVHVRRGRETKTTHPELWVVTALSLPAVVAGLVTTSLVASALVCSAGCDAALTSTVKAQMKMGG